MYILVSGRVDACGCIGEWAELMLVNILVSVNVCGYIGVWSELILVIILVSGQS